MTDDMLDRELRHIADRNRAVLLAEQRLAMTIALAGPTELLGEPAVVDALRRLDDPDSRVFDDPEKERLRRLGAAARARRRDRALAKNGDPAAQARLDADQAALDGARPVPCDLCALTHPIGVPLWTGCLDWQIARLDGTRPPTLAEQIDDAESMVGTVWR